MPNQDLSPSTDTNIQTKLGLVVRSYRNQLGITQEELAWRADLHRTYIADIERGGRNITLRSITLLAKALKTTVGLLLTEAESGAVRISDRKRAASEVLLVEDDPCDAELTLRAFSRANFVNPVRVVEDGEAALDFLMRAVSAPGGETALPCLVLLDLGLPKVSGVEVLRQMKADAALQSIPVVVLSGSRRDRTILECSQLGAHHYIIKPVDFASFQKATAGLSLRWMLAEPGTKSAPTGPF